MSKEIDREFEGVELAIEIERQRKEKADIKIGGNWKWTSL